MTDDGWFVVMAPWKSFGLAVILFVPFCENARAAGSGLSGTGASKPPVPNEQRPGYHVGDFRVRPSLVLGSRYDDNVFYSDRDVVSDWILLISPQLKIDSTWARHALSFRAGVEAAAYDRFHSENYHDRWLDIDGHRIVSDSIRLFGGLGYKLGHEGRDSPDSRLGGLEPTIFRSLNANAGLRADTANASYQLGVTYEALDFDDVAADGGHDRQ